MFPLSSFDLFKTFQDGYREATRIKNTHNLKPNLANLTHLVRNGFSIWRGPQSIVPKHNQKQNEQRLDVLPSFERLK